MVLVSSDTPMSAFDASSDEEEGELDMSPFHVDWLDLSCVGITEKLGLCALPGCKFKDTWRSLEADIASLKRMNVQEAFVLCSRGELNKYRVPWLLHEYTGAEITVRHYPFPDGHIPNISNLAKMLEEIKVNLTKNTKTILHCFGGLGRTCLVSVCLLLLLDPTMDIETAIQKLKQLRGPRAIQSVKQYNFITDFRELYGEFEKQQEEASRSVSR